MLERHLVLLFITTHGFLHLLYTSCKACHVCRMVGFHVTQKAGLAPTGILANAAKSLGYASVAALLEVNPDAARVMQAAKEAKLPQVSCQVM